MALYFVEIIVWRYETRMNYVIHCGKLIDGTGRPVQEDMLVYTKDGKIESVKKRCQVNTFKGYQYIDAKEKTVMPGLIDSHRHFFNNGGPTAGIGLTPRQILKNMSETIRGGVTSALDLGSAHVIRSLVHVPFIKPRIFFAISILTCKGGYPAEYFTKSLYKLGAAVELDTDDEIKKKVRTLAKQGVSVIKTVSVSKTFDSRNQVNWTNHQLKVLCDEAHDLNLKVCAHITIRTIMPKPFAVE